jgi:hypothetical protein
VEKIRTTRLITELEIQGKGVVNGENLNKLQQQNEIFLFRRKQIPVPYAKHGTGNAGQRSFERQSKPITAAE